jgi:hypothetical protein
MTSNLVFLFHPFMVATRFTRPITWLLLYSYKKKKKIYIYQRQLKHISINPYFVFSYLIKRGILQDEHGPSVHIRSLGGNKPVSQYINKTVLKDLKDKCFAIRSKISYLRNENHFCITQPRF